MPFSTSSSDGRPKRVNESSGLSTVGRLLKPIAKSLGRKLTSVVLFGSLARGTSGSNSDVDLFVITNEHPGRLKGSDQPQFQPGSSSTALRRALWSELHSPPTHGVAHTVDGEEFTIRVDTLEVSIIVRDRADADITVPLYLELMSDGIVMLDRGGFFARLMNRFWLSTMHLVSVEVWPGSPRCWILSRVSHETLHRVGFDLLAASDISDAVSSLVSRVPFTTGPTLTVEEARTASRRLLNATFLRHGIWPGNLEGSNRWYLRHFGALCSTHRVLAFCLLNSLRRLDDCYTLADLDAIALELVAIAGGERARESRRMTMSYNLRSTYKDPVA